MTTFATITMAVALVLGVFGSASAQGAGTVAGDWVADYKGTMGQAFKFHLSLKQDGEAVSGTFANLSTTPQVPERPIRGTFKNGVLTIGNAIQGTVEGDVMTGTMQAQTGQHVNFRATRTK